MPIDSRNMFTSVDTFSRESVFIEPSSVNPNLRASKIHEYLRTAILFAMKIIIIAASLIAITVIVEKYYSHMIIDVTMIIIEYELDTCQMNYAIPTKIKVQNFLPNGYQNSEVKKK